MPTQPTYQMTAFPPQDKPLLVWDGECGFCQFWVQRWEHFFGDRLNYAPYQQAASQFPDIPRDNFKGAVQLIETNGRVYPGAATVYHSLCIGKPKLCGPEQLYEQSEAFRQISDLTYHLISENRSFLYKATVSLFGKNPDRTKPYWAYWLLGLAGVGTGLALLLRNRRNA